MQFGCTVRRPLTIRMYLSVLLFLLCANSELNTSVALAHAPPSPSSTELYTPGKSIHLPVNGVGTWREISLSRRSNAQPLERDSGSLRASSATSWTVQTSSLQKCKSTAWILGLPLMWLAISY
ncbi:uncharacterized protein LOC110838534 [Zootermopsis nevadensis]|uniref:uncharacterized protein LOC110838534 n=1 Tax=Zootermopsis nevadensis TaxID=136037 RepID=UPI000B8ED6A4|nr:uncharacterized protein LOC110838534 [Zootermopsis nevadensis]